MHGGRTMGKYSEVFVAFDVAKKKHAVAIAEGGRTGEVRFMGDVENSPLSIEKTIRRLATRYDRLHVCFEAGPTGYGLYRQVQALGHECMVVAPRRTAFPIGTPARHGFMFLAMSTGTGRFIKHYHLCRRRLLEGGRRARVRR